MKTGDEGVKNRIDKFMTAGCYLWILVVVVGVSYLWVKAIMNPYEPVSGNNEPVISGKLKLALDTLKMLHAIDKVSESMLVTDVKKVEAAEQIIDDFPVKLKQWQISQEEIYIKEDTSGIIGVGIGVVIGGIILIPERYERVQRIEFQPVVLEEERKQALRFLFHARWTLADQVFGNKNEASDLFESQLLENVMFSSVGLQTLARKVRGL